MRNSSFFYLLPRHLEDTLAELSLEELSQRSGLFKRAGRKLTAKNLLLGFYRSVFSSRAMFSFSHWALQISLLLQASISKQALAKRVNKRQHSFAQMLLGQCLAYQVRKLSFSKSTHGLFTSFNRVLLQDSTVLKVADCLASIFKGNRAKGGNSASARLQHVYELKSEQSIAFELTSYTVNDQAASAHILELLQEGDLLIRDLGYFALPVFRQIQQHKAFYLSRFNDNTNLYELHQDSKMDLCKALGKDNVLDRYFRLGNKEKLRTRVVAVKLPDHVAAERRRKLVKKSKTDPRKKYGKRYSYLLGWAIFITNVEAQTWTVGQLLQAYGFRWRIETIFKCWKTHFHLTDLCRKGKMSENMVRIFIFYMLSLITLFWVNAYKSWFDKVYQASGKYLSIFKFADVAMACTDIEDEHFLLEIFAKFAVYDKHQKRINYMQALMENQNISSYEILSP